MWWFSEVRIIEMDFMFNKHHNYVNCTCNRQQQSLLLLCVPLNYISTNNKALYMQYIHESTE